MLELGSEMRVKTQRKTVSLKPKSVAIPIIA